MGCGGRWLATAGREASCRRGAVRGAAARTALNGLADPTAEPLSPPQPTLRNEHDSPAARDEQRHDAPHIEQPADCQA